MHLRRSVVLINLLFFLIFLAGAVFLLVEMISSPNPGFGYELLSSTGCRRMEYIFFFKAFYIFCLLYAIFFPFLFIPLFLTVWKYKRLLALALLLFLPVFSWMEVNAGVQSGFRYRAELLERFGKDEKGYMAVDRLMSPEIRSEYDKGPRAKTCILAMLAGWLILPIWNLIFFIPLVYMVMKKLRESRKKNSSNESISAP